MKKYSLRWMTSAVAGVTALVAVAAAPANAAPANVNTKCGTYICVHTAHHEKFVQDITVQTRDGLPGKLHAWWGNFSSPRVTSASHRWTVGREQSASLVCGALERGGRQIEERCVKI
jgi:hypothetical protein